MKKIIFIGIIAFALSALAGCSHKDSNVQAVEIAEADQDH